MRFEGAASHIRPPFALKARYLAQVWTLNTAPGAGGGQISLLHSIRASHVLEANTNIFS